MSRPSASSETVKVWELSSVDHLSSLREELGAVLGGESSPDGRLSETPDKLVLIASELATNALRHGRPPTRARLAKDEGYWLLEVSDREPDAVPLIAGERAPGAGGMGLRLARKLSLDVGWYTDGDVKTVWATFAT
ncbi:ATP-binding protein [Cellulosimicrobium arenosum]|uniref:ATP-binding protein n=1 Tax=Cellulosimicrobium arenosum TaxID=2708133 RepID=A0A927IZC4_9MICO|nr:ATP-binding protein [Cellulosimicrobium arenosum]MBD8078413.1 ATP-binding protein [Cellulosimicrobium arenosum]